MATAPSLVPVEAPVDPAAVPVAPEADRLEAILATLESRFDQVGEGLAGSVAAIDAMITGLTGVAQLFDHGVGSAAVADLTQAARGLLAVSGEIEARSVEIAGVEAIARGLRDKAREVMRCLQVLDVYGMNVKITAGGLPQFMDFADDMRRKLQDGDREFRALEAMVSELELGLRELAGSDQILREECRRVIPRVPDALVRDAAQLQAHQAGLTTMAAAIAGQAKQVQAELYVAIQALQIGDRVRQRLEHVCSGGEILARLEADDSLTRGQRDRAQGALSDLLARLAWAAAEEYEQDYDRLVASLAGLGRQADALVAQHLPAEAGANAFLARLEEGVENARAMLQQLARADSDGRDTLALIIQTADAVTARAEAITMLRLDVQHMAINIGLSCRTSESVGRPVLVIANEIRRFSAQLDTIADDILVQRGALADACSRIGAQAAAGSAGSGAELARFLAVMRDCGHRSAETLAVVEAQSGTVQQGLTAVRAALAEVADVGQRTRRVAERFAAAALPADADPAQIALLQPLWDELARHYTMADERDLHNASLPPGAAGVPVAQAAAASADADDDEDDGLF